MVLGQCRLSLRLSHLKAKLGSTRRRRRTTTNPGLCHLTWTRLPWRRRRKLFALEPHTAQCGLDAAGEQVVPIRSTGTDLVRFKEIPHHLLACGLFQQAKYHLRKLCVLVTEQIVLPKTARR